MSRTRLSKVTITPRGAWDATTEYKRLDAVSNGGASWLAMQDNTGVTPVEGEDWMNLVNVTKDSVVDALGYKPEKAYGDYELIETITLAEDTASIVRTQEPDGTVYSFKKLSMYIVGKCTAASNGNIYFASANNTLLCSAPIARSSSNGTVLCRTEIINGMVWTNTSNAVGSSGTTAALYIARFPSQYSWNNGITSIKATCTTSAFASGTVISIYAVRN